MLPRAQKAVCRSSRSAYCFLCIREYQAVSIVCVDYLATTINTTKEKCLHSSFIAQKSGCQTGREDNSEM